MGAKDITVLSLLYLGALLIPVALISKVLGLNIIKNMIVSSSRMVVQLSLVGVYLKYIFKFNHPVVNIIYVLVMIFAASVSVIRSSNLRFRIFFLPLFLSIMIPHFGMVLFFNGVIADIPNILDARYLVTIGGMILGNCLQGNIVSLRNFYHSLKDQEKFYYYSIAAGATRLEAIRPYFREAVLASVQPTLAGMATIGLVALPGMMTGQILGGSVPMVAIKYQIAIMFAIFIAKFISVILSILFSVGSGIDSYDRLKSGIFKE